MFTETEVTECSFRLEFHQMPNGMQVPGVVVTVLYVLKDEEGRVIPYHAPPIQKWFSLEELPREIAECLDTLIKLVKPTPAEVQQLLSWSTAPLSQAPFERAIAARKRGEKPKIEPLRISPPPFMKAEPEREGE